MPGSEPPCRKERPRYRISLTPTLTPGKKHAPNQWPRTAGPRSATPKLKDQTARKSGDDPAQSYKTEASVNVEVKATCNFLGRALERLHLTHKVQEEGALPFRTELQGLIQQMAGQYLARSQNWYPWRLILPKFNAADQQCQDFTFQRSRTF